MVSQLALARQNRATESRCLILPEKFPTPRFTFGDCVKTNENDYGQVVGMTLFRYGEESFWIYYLDLTCDSPNFWSYQGCEYNDSPCSNGYYQDWLIFDD